MKTFGLNKRSGFTLIEIIIVVVILGILAAVALPRLSENINKSKAAEVFQLGGAVGRAFDRCLAQESGGNVVTSGMVANCNTTLLLNLTTPSTVNFAYVIGGIGAASVNLNFTATLVGGATTDIIGFSYGGADGSVVKSCAGIFTKLCK